MFRESRKHRRCLTEADCARLTSESEPAQAARRMRLEVLFARLRLPPEAWQEFLEKVETEPRYRELVRPKLAAVK